MNKTPQNSKQLLLAIFATLVISLAGCSSDSGTSSSSNPLPQPSVDCNGSSCLD